MLKRILPVLLVVFMVMMDISVLPVLAVEISEYLPVLTMLTVIAMGMLYGRSRGLLYGMVGGLLIDIVAANPVGMNTIIYMAFGLISGMFARRTRTSFVPAIAVPVVLLAVYELVALVYGYVSLAAVPSAVLVPALVRVAAGTALVQPVLLRINITAKKDEATYTKTRRTVR